MPKLPPPPRTPQNRSEFRSLLAWTNSPSAVTRSTEMSWSIDNPCLRMIQPIPPPSVSPATPVWVTMPDGTARPNAWVSRSRSPSSAPACTRAVRASGSTRIPFISERSITTASSATEKPGNECPPLRTATGSPLVRPNFTAAMTSETPAQRMIIAGCRSNEPFQILRSTS